MFFLLISGLSSAQNKSEGSLDLLNQNIAKKEAFDEIRLNRITVLEARLKDNLNLIDTYNQYALLYNEYKSFNYDKAFYYSQKMQTAGRRLKDPVKIADGKIKFGFILLSSGMFKETVDSLNTVDVNILPDSMKREYYFLTARTYYDLADYDKDKYYSPIYNKKANVYIDSAISYSSPDSYDYTYNLGLKFLKLGNRGRAEVLLQKLMDSYNLSSHQLLSLLLRSVTSISRQRKKTKQ
jgi:hypothetical protein